MTESRIKYTKIGLSVDDSAFVIKRMRVINVQGSPFLWMGVRQKQTRQFSSCFLDPRADYDAAIIGKIFFRSNAISALLHSAGCADDILRIVRLSSAVVDQTAKACFLEMIKAEKEISSEKRHVVRRYVDMAKQKENGAVLTWLPPERRHRHPYRPRRGNVSHPLFFG